MPIGKSFTSSSGPEGIISPFNMQELLDQIKYLERNRKTLRGVLEGNFDDVAAKELLSEQEQKLKEDIKIRKEQIKAYTESADYRKAVEQELPTKITTEPNNFTSRTASGEIPEASLKSPVQTLKPPQIPTKENINRIKDLASQNTLKRTKNLENLRGMLNFAEQTRGGVIDLPESWKYMVDTTTKKLVEKTSSLNGIKNFLGSFARGVALSPAFEFTAPPSAGPVEGTPEYDLEMGRISMGEFKNLKQREAQE